MITTTETIASQSPELLRNSIDERIIKVRPMSTPVDQLSRCGRSRHAGSMTVEYYSVDTKKTQAELSAAFAGGKGQRVNDELVSFHLETTDDSLFELSETILVPDVTGYDADNHPCGYLAFYVLDRPSGGGIDVVAINPRRVSSMGRTEVNLEAMPAGTRLVRMARAATELDVQTAQFAALPQKARNNCQIFKMQVEQSTLAKIAEKEVGWTFSDQEEAAIIDMRLGMEKNFLFGAAAKIYDPRKNETVYFTGGIWNQAGRSHSLALDTLTEADLVDLCSAAFAQNNGSRRKILLAGTGFVEALSKLQYNKVVTAGETFAKWGIEFKEIRSNFGSLYLLHSEIFDQCGHRNDGFIVDPDYMTKYVHMPFQAETLDLRRSGVRNTDAVVLTEASCLVLRYPDAHIRVLGTISTDETASL